MTCLHLHLHVLLTALGVQGCNCISSRSSGNLSEQVHVAQSPWRLGAKRNLLVVEQHPAPLSPQVAHVVPAGQIAAHVADEGRQLIPVQELVVRDAEISLLEVLQHCMPG